LSDIEEEDDEFDQEVDALPPRETRVIQDAEDGVTVSVGESLHRQQVDLEIGDVIAMCITDEASLVETELPDSRRKTVENHTGDCGIQWDTGLIPASLDSRRRAVEMREKLVTAYTGVHQHMQCNAEKNKRYDGLGLRPKKFQIGQWVLYFNPRKLRGKQMEWCRQYEGPYLVIETPSSVTAKIQRTAKMTAKTVHIYRLKAYLGTPPRSWLPAITGDSNTTVDPCTATSPIPPDTLIGPIMPPSTGQQTMPRPVNRRQNGAGKQRDLGAGRPSSALPTSLERVKESERYIPDNSSYPDADLIPVREESSKPDASSIQWDAVLTPVSEEIVADAPAFDHVTTSAAVVRGKGESEETAGRPLPVPREVHATPAGESEREGRDVAGKSWKRCRVHTGVIRQRSCKGRNAFGTVTADIHSVYDNNNRDTVMSYSQLPPVSVPKGDKTADTDRSRVISPERPSFVLNSLANECVSANSEFEGSREEVYNTDLRARESRPQWDRKSPKKFADFHMEN